MPWARFMAFYGARRSGLLVECVEEDGGRRATKIDRGDGAATVRPAVRDGRSQQRHE